jgi:hypothetical protein
MATDKTTTPPTDPKPDETSSGGPITMKDIRSAISEIVTGLIPTSEPKKETGESETPPVNIKEQVDAAIAVIKRREAREEKERSIDMQLSELREKTAEKAPLDRPRRHRFMGWGD